ncbi:MULTISPECIES: class Ib ribonucleoside-diphosphate reductase assembly flavoprotein NrdI [unclassified Enterococcus]|uniref:class Ib ribonucleoside-diphosphate reductase assembly flavoprotein NrdI n=1 Tax=unclassified Enterococcus TaxID=2608891 RepID=UPI001554407E|nr:MULTISPECIES: class Ib ribonucleoside-diphosphate reductase assembly flavoprotein NrdI [unclassified Enterococcus]MBS7577555.1 class Ib ribonucleoside-diphosphate reductase assembly flavoprotein NrdI [Enterococcus sp. MMGLQ5-2]MBS7584946.1 class Ib ribonucleoside-diphosphate reductase assembly flavoprotein NrdI [Enterococcus sp. MMGLQ5-1]NPD12801.1 class Ib ribonucleoside-diphosphate reductase assembly flavoprotein NrdI [Enterococcus sp. MMGLQ5-1]NPD37388.1 class Ib ribonucleoside-diphosphat
MEIIFFSLTGQTRRFVNKLGFASSDISSNPFLNVNTNYILIVPTYDPDMTEIANQFLEFETNLSYCKGIIGTGNKNFADLFIYTAKDLAAEYNLPVLYGLEFSGTPTDVANVQKIINNMESERL